MEINKLFRNVYAYMFMALMITFLTGYIVSENMGLARTIYSGLGLPIIVLSELAVVIFLSFRIEKIKPTTAKLLFFLYSILTGLTFGGIFLVYTMNSVILAFFITALMFLILSVVGYTTQKDLTKVGTILFVGLIAIIVVGLVNMFLQSTMLEMILSIGVIVIFSGLIIFDTQKIKNMYSLKSDTVNVDNIAIYGALQLYLDFINIFIEILKIFGKSRD